MQGYSLHHFATFDDYRDVPRFAIFRLVFLDHTLQQKQDVL